MQKLSSPKRTVGFQPPAVGEEEVAAVAETLRSGWLTTGPRAAELERRMADYLEARHVLAVSSGTAAMHLALLALGVGPGRRGDHEPDHLARDRERDRPRGRDAGVRRRARRATSTSTRSTRARARHRRGRRRSSPSTSPASRPTYEPLLELGLPVLEDAAHAAETRYRGRKVGSIADATAFSLYATKNIAAGEGGLIATNSDDVAEAVQELRLMRRGDGSIYDVTVPGYKANLSDLLAAIALCQLDKVDEHAAIRERQFAIYDEGLAELDGVTPLERDPRNIARAAPLRRSGSTPSAPAPTATPTRRRSPPRESRPRSTSCRCTGSPGTASASPSSQPLPVAEQRGRRGALAPALARACR